MKMTTSAIGWVVLTDVVIVMYSTLCGPLKVNTKAVVNVGWLIAVICI